jgi:maleate isomerase
MDDHAELMAAGVRERRKVGLIVPSSNTTVETELPRLLGRHADVDFTFHSSRLRMRAVSRTELAAMNAQADRCIEEVADAGIDAVLYACLVAVMVQGQGAHATVEADLRGGLDAAGSDAKVVTSAGALVYALRAMEVRRVAMVMPYMCSLAEDVVGYVEGEGIEVAGWRTLEVPDNRDVGRIPGPRLLAAARELDCRGVDALVLSACVQMPSLDLVEAVEAELGLPVVTASTAGALALLHRLGLPAHLPGAGVLLRSGSAPSPSVDQLIVK